MRWGDEASGSEERGHSDTAANEAGVGELRGRKATECGRGEGAYSQPDASRAVGLDRLNSFEA